MIAVHRRMFIYPLLSHGACIPGHLFDSTPYSIPCQRSTGRSPGASRESELAAKCKQQRDEWIDLMFKTRIASPPRVAAPPQVPGGPPKPKKKKGKK